MSRSNPYDNLTASTKEATESWQDSSGKIITVVGALLILFSLAAPYLFSAKAHWSEEQAKQMQAAEATIHRLAGHGSERDGRHAHQPVDHLGEEYDAAVKQRQALRKQFEQAADRPERIGRWLFWGGVLLTMLGFVVSRTNGTTPG